MTLQSRKLLQTRKGYQRINICDKNAMINVVFKFIIIKSVCQYYVNG